MLIQILINLETLDAVCEDPDVTVNEVKTADGQLLVEISKPDPEITMTPP